MMFKPCVVIPNYNHLEVIETTLASFELPVFLVDDCSSCDVAQHLIAIADKYPHVTLLQHAYNQGKGAAVMTGLRAAAKAGYSHALQVDADGQHSLSDARHFLALAQQQPEALITGIPVYDDSVPKHRFYARYITHVWVWIETLSLELKDSMCGFRVYPLAPSITLLDKSRLGKRMDFDTEILVRHYWQATPIVQVPTQVIYPENGVSHFRAWEDNVLITKMHTRLFFGMLWRSPRLLWRKRRQLHWSAIGERGSLWGLKVALAAYRLGGRYLAKLLLYPVISYFFLSGFKARHASKKFLTKAAAQSTSALPTRVRWWHSLQHFFSFGNAALNRLDAWSGRLNAQQVDFPEKQHLVDLLQAGKGALLLTSHLGQIEMCRALVEKQYSTRLNVVVFTAHASKFNHVVSELNPDSQLNLVHISEIGPDLSIRLAQFLEAGELVAIAADRTPASSFGRVNSLPFLGELAPFPQGPFILACLLRCPVFSLFCMQQSDSSYRVYLDKLSDDMGGPRSSRQERILLASQAYVANLEQLALRYPMQWFNFYDYWCPDSIGTMKKG